MRSIVLLLLMLPSFSYADGTYDIDSSWTRPEHREDGTVIEEDEYLSYEICLKYEEDGECVIIEALGTEDHIFDIVPKDGTPIYVEVRAVDSCGTKSEWSNTGTKIVYTEEQITAWVAWYRRLWWWVWYQNYLNGEG